MGTGDGGLTDVVLAASAAASDARRWPDVLTALRDRFGATAAAIHTPAPSVLSRESGEPASLGDAESPRQLLASIGLPPLAWEDYVDWSAQDPWLGALRGASVPNGTVIVGRELCDWPELDRTAYYNEYSASCGIRGNLTIVIDDGAKVDEAPPTLLGLFRRPGLEEFSHDDRRALRAVHTPLQLALHAHWSLARARRGERIAVDALAAVPSPLWVLAGDGAVLYANPTAEALLARTAWVGARHGRLVRLGQVGDAVLRESLRRASRGAVQTLSLWMSASPPRAGLDQATARLVPLPEDNACRAAWPLAQCLLVIDEPERHPPSQRLAAVVSHYRLTPAEARLLAQLAQGLSAREIAETCCVSIHTVRAQLRSLFDKTDVRRQSALLQLVGRIDSPY